MRNFLALAAVGAALLFSPALRAQNYSIDWYTIAGGGGTSSAGPYTLSGTIGQPATSTLTGGNYSLTGGFWSIISVIQTLGAPTLSITLTNHTATISWLEPATGFILQESANLATSVWTPAPVVLTTNSDGTISTTVNATTGYQYYRLQKP
jgi:hypothetical protein